MVYGEGNFQKHEHFLKKNVVFFSYDANIGAPSSLIVFLRFQNTLPKMLMAFP